MMNSSMSLEEMVAIQMADDAAEDAANEAFYDACDTAFAEGRDVIECAPTLRSAELKGVLPISRNSAG